MAEIAGPLILTALYLLALTLIASAAERSPRLARVGRHPVAFALSLGVYATSWTFYGAAGYAEREGYGFLAINLGVALSCLAIPVLWSPLAALVRRHRLASTADLFAFRFQSQRVGAFVTLFMVLGLLPYLALQLRAIGAAAAHLTTTTPPAWLPTVYALLLSLFAVAFGARYADPWARRPGLLLTLAAESLVKLVALFIVTAYALSETFDGPAGFSAYLERTPEALTHLFTPVREGPWAALLLLAFAGAFLLPRQFHIAFVEHPNPDALRRAMWVFPLFLLLLNLPVPILYLAGVVSAPAGTLPDMFVLSASHAPLAQLAAFIGGVSAASAMVLVSSIALSGMVVNHVVIPLGRARALPDARVRLMRRLVIAAIVLASFAFQLVIPRSGLLVDLGLVSFAAVAQLLPATLATLFWPRATRRGMVLGLVGGVVVWATFLALPLLAPDHSPAGLLDDLGVDGDPRGITVFLSLGVNLFLLVAGSLSAPARAVERAAARACTAGHHAAVGPIPVSVGELEARLAAALGPEDARAVIDRALDALALARDEVRPLELRELASIVRRNMSERVGPLAARLVVGAPSPEDVREEAATLAAELRVREAHDVASAALEHDGAARTLALVRRFLSNVVEDLPVPMCAATAEGEVLLWNHRLAALSGIDPAVAVGSRLDQLAPPWDALLGHPGGDGEQTAVSAGRRLVLKVGRSTLEGGGAAAGAQVVIVEDLTEPELLRAQAAHQDRLASIGRLAAGVAHEILNPLTGILMVTASLQEEPEATDVPDRLGLIVHEAHRIEAIVRSLLQYSRAGALGNEPVQRVRQSLRPLADEAVRLVRLGRRARQLTWRVDVAPELEASVDGARIAQVLVNLLSNARDASPDGGTVAVIGRANGAGVLLEVCDDGPGIPAELHTRIFEPFFTTKAPGEGTGLGLSLVHRIVSAHGGEVDYRRDPSGPTRFCVTFAT